MLTDEQLAVMERLNFSITPLSYGLRGVGSGYFSWMKKPAAACSRKFWVV